MSKYVSMFLFVAINYFHCKPLDNIHTHTMDDYKILQLSKKHAVKTA